MPHVIGPLRRVLAAIASLPRPPDAILATGDLTESGHRDEYCRLRDLIAAIRIPVFLLPGNHDRREALRAVFPDHGYLHGGDAVLFTIEGEAMRVIALDSSQSPRQGGYLDETRLDWLEAALSRRPATPTMLALHHPPFRTGLRYFDDQPFEGRARLSAIVRRHRQIRRIACGHVHQVLARRWSGTIAISAPSTAPSLVVRPRVFGFSFAGGGFLLHRPESGGRIATLRARIPFDVAESAIA